MQTGHLFDENGDYIGVWLEGVEIPEEYTLYQGDISNDLYKPKLVDGEIVEGAEFNLVAYKTEKIQLISSFRDAELTAGFTSTVTIASAQTVVEFDYSAISQTRFTKQGTLLIVDPTIDEIQWGTKNSGFIVINRAEFIQVLKDAGQHEIAIEFKYLYAKAFIENSASKEEVDLIVSGW